MPTTPRRTLGALAAGTAVTALALTLTAPAQAAPSAASVAGVTSATAVTSTTTVTTSAAADSRIASKLTARMTSTLFGTKVTGAVVDAASGKVVWTKNGNTAYMPASNAKLVTATSALRFLGPGYRFTTNVRRGSGNAVILVGSGDPSFSTAQVNALAKSTAAYLKAHNMTTAKVYFDDTRFPAPTLAYGWLSTDVPSSATWLRALVVDGRDLYDTSLDAANRFTYALRANGISVGRYGRVKASSTSTIMASSQGQTMSQMVSHMLVTSDNDYAEALHRLVAIKMGYGYTWNAARSAQANRLRNEGLAATALYDGSGLSRADRMTGLQLARVMTNAFEPANATVFATLRSPTGLPVAGQTGTLQTKYDRFVTAQSRCAVGKVYAKTGTLSNAAALTGYTTGTDGRVKAFAFVVNGSSALKVRQGLDMLAATVNGCY